MFYVTPNDPVPERNVWANETKHRLDVIKEKRALLAQEEKTARQTCNHTYTSGTSAFIRKHGCGPDNDETMSICSVCEC